MTIKEAQAIVRKASPGYLAQHPPTGMVPPPLVKKEASPEPRPIGQMALSQPSTITELAAALRNPLPPPAPGPRCYSALEAMKSFKPLTLEAVRDIMARESAARDEIMRAYTERTGQQVDYCEECELGVQEHEIEEGWQTRVVESKCDECDGLGVKAI